VPSESLWMNHKALLIQTVHRQKQSKAMFCKVFL
jgi:hypothetical protein